MALVPNPEFMEDLIRLGAARARACFNCGNCSASCPLAESNPFYPRRIIRYAQLGAAERILQSPGIWLCYHCNECTPMCLREADPGELLMALRRWAITKYSWTKLTAKLYTSKAFAFLFYLAAAAFFTIGILLFHGPVDREAVRLSLFLPTPLIDVVGLSLGAFVLGTVALNLWRMYRHLREATPVKFSLAGFFRTFIYEVVLQQRYQKCADKKMWLMHTAIVNGFLLLALTTALAFVFNPGGAPEMVPLAVRALGTVGGVALVAGASMATWRRLTGKEGYSHHTDWIFLQLVLLAGLSGLGLEATAYAALPLASYVLYGFHLVVVALLILAAPHTKFAHAVYRGLAVYVYRARRETAARQVATGHV